MQLITTPADNAMRGHDLSSPVVVTDTHRRAVAYTVHHAASDRYSVMTLDGRWVIPGKDGYKSRGAATRYVRTNEADLVPAVPVVEPALCAQRVYRRSYGSSSRITCGRSLHVSVNGRMQCPSCHKFADSYPEGFASEGDRRGTHTMSWVRERGDVERRESLLSEAVAGRPVDAAAAEASGKALVEARVQCAEAERASAIVKGYLTEVESDSADARAWADRAESAETLSAVREAAAMAREFATHAEVVQRAAAPYPSLAQSASESAYVASNGDVVMPEHAKAADRAYLDANGHAATCDERMGEIEEYAQEAQDAARKAEECAEDLCLTCGGFECACTAIMVAVLAGAPVPMTDVEAADTTPKAFASDGQGSLDDVPAELAPAVRPAQAKRAASTLVVNVRYSPDVDADAGLSDRPGWAQGRTGERAAVLRGHVTEADAREAVRRFPLCVQINGRGTDSEKRRPSADMHCAGVTLDLDAARGGRPGSDNADMIAAHAFRGTLPDGTPVAGAWGAIGRAFAEWMIVNRPEYVCASAESQAYGAAILRQREAVAATDAATGAVSLGKARTEAARAKVARDAILHAYDLTDEAYDALWAMTGRALEAATDAERAYRARGFEFGDTVARYAAGAAEVAAELWQFAERGGLTLPRVAPVAPPVAADVQADPGAVDGWESEGGACPGVEVPRAAEGGQPASPADSTPAPSAPAGCGPVTAEVVDYRTGGVLLRTRCACGTVHGGHVPVTSRGCAGAPARVMADVTDWDTENALVAAGVRPMTDRRAWQRGLLVSSHQSDVRGFATVVPVAPVVPVDVPTAPATTDVPTPAGSAEDKAANLRAAERNARNTLAMMSKGPQRSKGNPDDSARVVLCWREEPIQQRWEVVASWRGHRFWVACHKGEWFITRQDKHPADLRESPRKWRKTEQVRTVDRKPIRSREQAEALMIARVEERRAFEATLRGTIADAATAPAPKWTPAPNIIKPPKTPKPLSPAEILAHWGDVVTYEEITPAEADHAAVGEAGPAGSDTDASSTPPVPVSGVDVVSDPCAVDAWEAEGGAVPGVEPPQAEYWLPADEQSGAPAQWESDRTRHYLRLIRAQDYVSTLGWATAHIKVMEAAEAGRLRMLTGNRFVALTASGGARPVKPQRVQALYGGGFLTRGRVRGEGDGRWAVLMASHAGREALALCTVWPAGVHATEQDAYKARLSHVVGRSWMTSDERKSWARRLRTPHGMMSAPCTREPAPEAEHAAPVAGTCGSTPDTAPAAPTAPAPASAASAANPGPQWPRAATAHTHSGLRHEQPGHTPRPQEKKTLSVTRTKRCQHSIPGYPDHLTCRNFDRAVQTLVPTPVPTPVPTLVLTPVPTLVLTPEGRGSPPAALTCDRSRTARRAQRGHDRDRWRSLTASRGYRRRSSSAPRQPTTRGRLWEVEFAAATDSRRPTSA